MSVQIFQQYQLAAMLAGDDKVAAAGASTTPPVTGYVAWWDASDATTITKDGSNLVSQWNDKSGNAYHCTESTNYPTWGSAILNGKDGINWTTSTKRMISGSITLGYFTIFSVIKLSATGMVYEHSNNTLNTGGCWLYSETDSYGTITCRRNAGSGKNISNGWCTDNVARVCAHVFGGAHSTHLFYQNGSATSLTNSSSATSDLDTSTVSAGFYFGRNSGSCTGYHFEHIVYNSALSSSDITSVSSWLGTKWGIY